MSRQSNGKDLVERYDDFLEEYVNYPSNAEAIVHNTLVNGMVPLHVIDVVQWGEQYKLEIDSSELAGETAIQRKIAAVRLTDILEEQADQYDDMMMTAQVLWKLLFPMEDYQPLDPHVFATNANHDIELSEPYIRNRYDKLIAWLTSQQQDHIIAHLQHIFRCHKDHIDDLTKNIIMTTMTPD